MTNLAQVVCAEVIQQTKNGGTLNALGILKADWLVLTGLALLVSLFMLVLINIFANFVRNQQLLAWTKFELFQVLATVCLVIFAVLAWIPGMCNFDMSILNDKASGINYSVPNPVQNGQHFKNMFVIVDDYFRMLERLGLLVLGEIMYISKWIVLLQKVTYFSSPLGLGTTDNPTDSIGQLNNVIFLIVSGFATSFLIIGVQGKIIEYMAYAALYYFLPFGVFFRAFEPTRGFGGTLMGLAFAFFLFYPIIIVANDYIMRATADQLTEELTEALKEQNQNSAGLGTEEVAKQSEEHAAKTSRGELEPGDVVQGVTSGTLFLLKPSAFYFVAGVVLPVLDFVILVEITRSLTGFMGESLDVSNLTRMI